jgi:hypothetical protein
MIGGIAGGIVTVLLMIGIYGIPMLIVAWLVRTFALMRRDQQRMLDLLASIESEVRAHGNRSRWGGS